MQALFIGQTYIDEAGLPALADIAAPERELEAQP